MKMKSFGDYCKTINLIAKSYKDCDDTLDGLFEEFENNGLVVEEVVTGDIATVTLPIGKMKRRKPTDVSEVAPEDPEIEKWILDNKEIFQKKYGKDWEKVLYATAWNIYNKKAK